MSALTQNLVDVGFNVRRAEAIGDGIETAVAAVSVVNPVGAVIDYAGAAAPSGWILCFGQAISRSTYSALFDVIGETYGAQVRKRGADQRASADGEAGSIGADQGSRGGAQQAASGSRTQAFGAALG
jgi:hypothetical protein